MTHFIFTADTSITTIAEPGLTCAPGSVLLLLCEDEPGEGHAVGVHGLPARHADAECDGCW